MVEFKNDSNFQELEPSIKIKQEICDDEILSKTKLVEEVNVKIEVKEEILQKDEINIKLEPKEECIDENEDEFYQYDDLSSVKNPKNSSCEICGKIFKTYGYLETHIQNVHEGIKNYKCDFCNKTFGHKHVLKRHITNIHEEPDPLKIEEKNINSVQYECEICGKKFSQFGNMRRHKKCVHEGIKDFQCDLCDKGFFDARHLKTHYSLVHEGRKIFPDQDFSSQTGKNQKCEYLPQDSWTPK